MSKVWSGSQSIYHGTYIRNVQDLPILGKNVMLQIKSYEYKCENSECDAVSTIEDFGDFLGYHRRKTERLEDFCVPWHWKPAAKVLHAYVDIPMQ